VQWDGTVSCVCVSVVKASFVSAQCISVVFMPCPGGLKIFCMTSVHYVSFSSLFFNPGHLCVVCVNCVK